MVPPECGLEDDFSTAGKTNSPLVPYAAAPVLVTQLTPCWTRNELHLRAIVATVAKPPGVLGRSKLRRILLSWGHT